MCFSPCDLHSFSIIALVVVVCKYAYMSIMTWVLQYCCETVTET